MEGPVIMYDGDSPDIVRVGFMTMPYFLKASFSYYSL